MTNKILLCLLLFFLFVACKKEQHTPVTYNVAGQWTLFSYQTNFGGGINASAIQYPCLANNITIFYNDSTSVVNYTGGGACFVTALQGPGGQPIGSPGQAPISSTWKLKGNILYITYPGDPKSIPGMLSINNGKLMVTFRDTLVSGVNTYYITTVDVKQ